MAKYFYKGFNANIEYSIKTMAYYVKVDYGSGHILSKEHSKEDAEKAAERIINGIIIGQYEEELNNV
jgi:hypothetical protein